MRLRIKRMKAKFYFFVLCSAIMYAILMYNYFDPNMLVRKLSFEFKKIVVHFDLKGAPPKIQYLEGLLKTLKRHRVTGILIEYEDMFPYAGNLVNLSARNRYERHELKKFLRTARQLDIEVIPLIQTFGHLEHVLKLEEFKHLREEDKSPDTICPSNLNSMTLIKDMLHQVITFHNSVSPLRHIHIGCDGINHFQKCDECVRKRTTKENLFTQHVLTIMNYIQNFNSSISVLAWDDTIRLPLFIQFRENDFHTPIENNVFSSLKKLEVVFWDYSYDSASVSYSNLYAYHNTFKSLWISTAYKGVDGRQSSLPDYVNRLLNHHNWLGILAEFQERGDSNLNIEGILLTGWSRFSHFDPLCELLPPSVPSLLMNLILITKYQMGVDYFDTYKDFPIFYNKYLLEDVSRELNCSTDFFGFYDLNESISHCAAFNNELVHLLKQYQTFVKNLQVKTRNELSYNSSFGYYIKVKHLNMNNVNKRLLWYKKQLEEVVRWKVRMQIAMTKYYDEFVIDEYVGSKVYTLVKQLSKVIKILDDYQKTQTWNRGPLSFPVKIYYS